MPNVVRFALPTARDQYLSGVGFFRDGILDVDANRLDLVQRARYLAQPYRAVEIGIVDSSTPPPTLPAEPAPPAADPYPMYLTDAEAAAQLAAGTGLVGAAAKGAFAPLHMPAPSATPGVDAAILAQKLTAAQALVASGGRPEIIFQSGVYLLPAGITVVEGVSYRGVSPILQPLVGGAGYMPDAEWEYVGGTVLRGDGTGDAIHGNTTPSETPIDGAFSASQMSGVHISGFGIENYVNGLAIGAKNVMGVVFGTIDEIYVRNCSGWGVRLINFQHVDIGVIRTCLCTNGQYYASETPYLTLMPGNSHARELFHKVVNSGQRSRGIVIGGFNSAGSPGLGGFDVDKLQVNAYNKTIISQTATFTSGSSSVTVADGSKFLPGMAVNFTAAGNGFTANNIYMVQSVAGNVLTLGSSRNGAAISASGSGTLTIQTYGFPNAEFVNCGSFRIHDLDLEGVCSVALYMENVSQANFSIATIPTTALVDLVGRGVVKTWIHNSSNGARTDFDAASASSSHFNGARSDNYGRSLMGMWFDAPTGSNALSISNGAQGNSGGDIHVRNGLFLYPGLAGMGEHIRAQNSATTLTGGMCGDIVSTPTAPLALTLPTINPQTTPATSHVGLWFEIFNVGTAAITVNTDGTQLMNKITGRTSATIQPGNSLKLVAVEDGTRWWAARPSVLLA